MSHRALYQRHQLNFLTVNSNRRATAKTVINHGGLNQFIHGLIGLLTSFTWKNASYFVNRYNYLQLLLIKQCCIISHKKCTVLYTVDSKDRKQVQYITRHKSIRVFQAICHIFISQIIKGKKVFPYRNDWYFYSASVPSNIFASK